MNFSNIHKLTTWHALTLFLMFSVLGIASCQTTDSNHKIEEADAVLHLDVYGKVDSLNSKKTNKKFVLLIPHSHSCSDTTELSDVLYFAKKGSILPSGEFHFPFSFPPKLLPGKPQCIKALVVSYDLSTHPAKFEYDSLLAGPKKLGANFVSQLREKPPIQSVRIDFTVHDSTKRAADDATMK